MANEVSMDAQLVQRGQDLRAAEIAFQEADGRYRDASRDRTIALNALNNQQKLFDELVAKMKAASPDEADWKRVLRPGAVQYVER